MDNGQCLLVISTSKRNWSVPLVTEEVHHTPPDSLGPVMEEYHKHLAREDSLVFQIFSRLEYHTPAN